MRENVIKSLWKTQINKHAGAFNSNDECAICLMSFGDNDDVTPLPCDIRHYFHTSCIEDWFK